MQSPRAFPAVAIILLRLAFPPGPQSQPPQNAPHPLPQFEVATVKPSIGYGSVGIYTYPGGRIHAGICTLRTLLMYAFDLHSYQVQGGPHWLDTEIFDIEAIPPDASSARKLKPSNPNQPMTEEQRQMLQSLLIDRFALRFHFATKQGRVYWLVKSGKQTRMMPTSNKDRTEIPIVSVLSYSDSVGNGRMVAKNATMSFLARRLSDILQLTIIDKTGVPGAFDFDISPPEPANADRTDSTLIALRSLGLKLQSAKGPVQTLVVEAASQPTPN